MQRDPTSFSGNIGDVDVRLLRLFCTVVEAGGFAPAEPILAIGLPSISKHVRELETRLGVTLCRRGRAGFALTVEGRKVYQAAKQLLGALEGFRDRMNDIHTEIVGELNLGIIDTLITDPQLRLPQVLAVAKSRAPRVRVNITIDPPNFLEKSVLDGSLHAAIISQRQHLPGIAYRPLHSESNNLYCAESHPLYPFCPDRITAEQIVTSEWVSRPYAKQEETSKILGELHRAATANDVEGVALLVLTGQYIGFLPDHYVASTRFPAHLRPIMPERFGYTVRMELATRKRGRHPPAVANFLADLEQDLALRNPAG